MIILGRICIAVILVIWTGWCFIKTLDNISKIRYNLRHGHKWWDMTCGEKE